MHKFLTKREKILKQKIVLGPILWLKEVEKAPKS